jgi:hypothetical protein
VTPCKPVGTYQRFGKAYCLYLQTDVNMGTLYSCCLVLWIRLVSYVDANVSEIHIVSIFSPDEGESMFLPKRLNRPTKLSSSLARQPYLRLGHPQKLLLAEVSGCCFFKFRSKSLYQGEVVSPTPNPRLSWRADIFCQGCLP